MHENFADWYRVAGVTVPEGLLQKRWSGLETLLEKPSNGLALQLARLFVLGPPAAGVFPEGLSEAFVKHDDTFTIRGSEYELQVLAGAACRQLIESKSKFATTAALGVVAGSFGRRSPQVEHVDAARAFLSRQGSVTRLATQIDDIPTLTKKRIQEMVPEQVFGQGLPHLKEPFFNVWGEVVTLLSAHRKAIDASARNLRLREEELAMLWWMHAEYSNTGRASFRDIGQIAGAIVFAVDLGDLTLAPPGPTTIVGLLAIALDKAGTGGSSGRCTLETVVNSTSREWRRIHAAEKLTTDIELLCPIHLALGRSLLTDGPSDWQPVFKKLCSAALDQDYQLLEIAQQTYLERMLLSIAQP